MHRTCFRVLAVALGVAAALPVAAVNRCVLEGGRVVYQDALCPAAAGASRVRLFTPPSDPAGRQRAAAEVAAAARLVRDSAPVPAPAVGMVHSPRAQGRGQGPLAGLADACLNLYRSGLRDPATAYWSGASLDKLDVLRITLHATNGYGGFVAKTVGCEVKDGQIDVARTRTNADRLGM